MKKFTRRQVGLIVCLSIIVCSLFTSAYYVLAPANPSVYLDDLPSAPTYTIKTDGTNYWAVRYDGQTFWDGTNGRTTIQSAIAAAPGGWVHITGGNYPIATTPIQLDGSELGSLRLTGDGWERGVSEPEGTVLSLATASMNIMEITDGMSVHMEGICFDLEWMNGNGIYAYPTGSSDYVLEGSDFNDLYFCHVQNGYSGVHFYDAMYYHVGAITIDTYGNGITLQETSYRKTGNSRWDYVFVRMLGNDGWGIRLYDDGTKRTNVAHFGYSFLYGNWNNDAEENNTAILCGGDFNKWDWVVTEAISYNVKFVDAAETNVIAGGFFTAGNMSIYCESGTSENVVRDVHEWTNIGDNPQMIVDESTSTNPNTFENIFTGTADGGYSGGNSFTSSTILKGKIMQKWGEYSSTSEASNDDWIAHNCIQEPVTISLTVEETDANYCIQLKAKNATHFQIYLYDLTAGASETVDKTIVWFADT